MESNQAGAFYLIISEPIKLPSTEYLITMNVDAKDLSMIDSVNYYIEPDGYTIQMKELEEQFLAEVTLKDWGGKKLHTKIDLKDGRHLECSVDLSDKQQIGIFTEDNGEKESKAIDNFVTRIAKGAVKTIPVVGGVLEEGIFGTLEAEAAEEEALKLHNALADLSKKFEGQSLTISEVLNRLESTTSFHEEVRTLLHELERYGTSDETTFSISKEMKEAVEKFLTRYGEELGEVLDWKLEEFDRIIERLAGVLSSRSVKEDNMAKKDEHVTRIIKELNALLDEDLDQLILSFDKAAQYVSRDASRKRRVIDFVRWVKTPGNPGLQAIYEKAEQLGIQL